MRSVNTVFTSRTLRNTSLMLLAVLTTACTSTAPRHTDPSTVPVMDAHHTREPADDTADEHNDKIIEDRTENSTEPLPPLISDLVLGEEVALRAIALVGKPYRYGGADLEGFDCSGLVYYIYHQLGIDIPRTAADQHRLAARVSRDELMPGDLVFFRISRKRISHVGIYVGDNRFVHAPQSGKRIVLRALDETYYTKHWVSAGRIAGRIG